VIDSAATSSFWREEDEHIATDEASGKVVMMPTGITTNVSAKALHPNTRLNKQARELDILPEFKHNALLSVCKLSNAGYTTIFHPNDGGVTVHWADDIYIKVKKEAILQGWRDDSGLWRVPIKDKVVNQNTDTLLIDRLAISDAVHNVYELANTEKTIRYLHAALGFPTKATMLKAIWSKWLISWPGLTVSTVHDFLPECDETPKGRMKQQRQGVRSTKPKTAQEEEAQDVNVMSILTSANKKKQKDVYFKI